MAVAFEGEISHIQIAQAANPEKESAWVAGEIKRLIRKEAYQYRDIAVICGSMDAYRFHLQEAFERMDIPYFVDATSKILHNPAMEILQGKLFGFSGKRSLKSLKTSHTGFHKIYFQQIYFFYGKAAETATKISHHTSIRKIPFQKLQKSL